MSELQQTSTIYLDFDGVLFPYWHKSHRGHGVSKQEAFSLTENTQDGLEPRWINSNQFYYPEIVQRIGQIAARGVRIMPSSSRSLDLFISYPEVLKGIGGANEYLVIDRYSPGNIDFKALAVFNNFYGIVDLSNEKRGWARQRSMVDIHPIAHSNESRAVWIDDHAKPDCLAHSVDARVNALVHDRSLKIINPLGSVGLTMKHLDEAEAFLFPNE